MRNSAQRCAAGPALGEGRAASPPGGIESKGGAGLVLGIVFAALTATAVLAPLLARWFARDAGWILGAVFLALTVAVLVQTPAIVAGDTIDFSMPWIPAADIAFALRLDGIGLLFTFLVLGVGALIMAYCARYFGRETSMSRFYVLMGLFAVAMLGVVLADDILLLFVFWELTSICSFFLIGGAALTADKPAMRAMVVTVGGGLGLLVAVCLLTIHAGTTRISIILADLSWMEGWVGPVVALCVILAAFTKSAQFPFHFWLPGAMAATTPVSAYLHAAAMVKAGIYLLMRFTPAFADLALWNALLVGVGLLTAIWGGILALKAHDLKILTAHSTVSQLGYLVAIIGVGTYHALAAAALHTLAHALFKATLFMMVGVVDHQAHTRDIRELGDLRKTMPISAVAAGLAALSLAGIFPLLGFYTKEKMFAGFLEFEGGSWMAMAAAAAALVAAILTFGYAARYWYYTFAGPARDGGDIREAPASFLLAPCVTALGGLVLGLSVPVLSPMAERVAADGGFGAVTIDIHIIPGLTPDLGMSVLAVTFGLGLFLMRERFAALQQRVNAPVTGNYLFDRGYDLSLATGHRVGDLTRSSSPAAHAPPALFLIACLGLAAWWWGMPVAPSIEGRTQPGDWLVVVLIILGVAATVLMRHRIAATVLLGVVGVLLAVWFLLLGAVDLALTQLTVEVLTVVALVLVLRRLPRHFHTVGRKRPASAPAAAIAVGLLAGIGTFLLTGRRELSPVSTWLLQNSEAESGGVNVVNTILVDFRALDTLGEVTVVGIAGIGVLALLETTRLRRERELAVHSGRPEDHAEDNAIILRVTAKTLAPVAALLSLWMLFRGHDDHGGGFIGALVLSAGLCLIHFAAANPLRSPIRRIKGVPLVAGGLVLSLAVGTLGLFYGGFLRPFPVELGFTYVPSSVIFDIGIYLMVIGAVVLMLNRLGGAVPLERVEASAEAAGAHGQGGEVMAVAGRTAEASSAGEAEGGGR
jgi:multicomponent Na+:H+ antiporter subunit A